MSARRTGQRGQTLTLMALTMLLVVVLGAMTLSIGSRIRHRLELQTIADTAAYSEAIATARTLNSMSLLNRASASHWVAMMGIQAELAWGSLAPAYLEGYAASAQYLEAQLCNADAVGRRNLKLASVLFYHSELSRWNSGSATDSAEINFPPAGISRAQYPVTSSFGYLDAEVAKEQREVWQATRQLAVLQQNLYRQLQGVLNQRQLSQEVVTRAGGPLVAVEKPADSQSRDPAWREFDNSVGMAGGPSQNLNGLPEAPTEQLPIAHAALGSRGSHFLIAGMTDWCQAAPTICGNHAPVPPKLTQSMTNIINYLRVKKGMNITASPGSIQLDTYFDNGLDYYTPPVSGTVNTGDPNASTRVGPVSVGFVSSLKGEGIGSVNMSYYSGACGKAYSINMPVVTSVRIFSGTNPQAMGSHYWGPDYEGAQKSNVAWTYFWGHGAPGAQYWGIYPAAYQDTHNDHQYWGEPNESSGHQVAPREYQDPKTGNYMGIMPGGLGFVFPQIQRTGAVGAFGQPKTPALLSRSTPTRADPWDLSFSFHFGSGPGSGINLQQGGAEIQGMSKSYMAALGSAIAYYHRRLPPGLPAPPSWGGWQTVDNNQVRWKEPPNMMNPFWHATLVPINVDEKDKNNYIDKTPNTSWRTPVTPPDGSEMLYSVGFDEYSQTYTALDQAGFRGFQ